MSVQFSKPLLWYFGLILHLVYLGVSLSGVLYHSSVLRVFDILLWVYPMRTELRGEPEMYTGSYTELKDPFLQLSLLCDTFQLSGAYFFIPLTRNMGFLGVFLLVFPIATLLEISLINIRRESRYKCMGNSPLDKSHHIFTSLPNPPAFTHFSDSEITACCVFFQRL